MRYQTENNLYFRKLQYSDELLQCSINKNKNILEKVFYDNEMICSWAFKRSTGFTGDFIYCKGIGKNSTDVEVVNKLFRQASDNFIEPGYEEYERFFCAGSARANPNRKIINRLNKAISEKLDKDKFDDELSRISLDMKSEFVGIDKLIKSDNSKKHYISEDICDDITNGKLAFMGFYQIADTNDLKSMIIYKILEKYYGCGETGTIYNYYRSKGDTYAACSGYASDEDIFYTGIFSGYDDAIFDDVIEKINIMKFNDEQLNTIKKRFVDDICFSCFQYGEKITLLPYILKTGHDLNVKDITDIADIINIDDLAVTANRKKHLLKVVM